MTVRKSGDERSVGQRLWDSWINGGASDCENAEDWYNDDTKLTAKEWAFLPVTFLIICLFAQGISLLELAYRTVACSLPLSFDGCLRALVRAESDRVSGNEFPNRRNRNRPQQSGVALCNSYPPLTDPGEDVDGRSHVSGNHPCDFPSTLCPTRGRNGLKDDWSPTESPIALPVYPRGSPKSPG